MAFMEKKRFRERFLSFQLAIQNDKQFNSVVLHLYGTVIRSRADYHSIAIVLFLRRKISAHCESEYFRDKRD